MQNRRRFLLTLTTGVVAMGFAVVSVLADELIGVITKVNVETKKITVEEKDTEKEIEITITDETEYVTKDGSIKVDLEKLAKGVEKAKEKGRKGIAAKITHEKGVASKIAPKKGFGKKKAG